MKGWQERKGNSNEGVLGTGNSFLIWVLFTRVYLYTLKKGYDNFLNIIQTFNNNVFKILLCPDGDTHAREEHVQL